MKWRNLFARFGKKILLVSALASIHILMNKNGGKIPESDLVTTLQQEQRQHLVQNQRNQHQHVYLHLQQNQQKVEKSLQQQVQKSNSRNSSSNFEALNKKESEDPRSIREVVRRHCEASKSGEDGNYVDEVSFITDNKKRVGYCHVPKVASSSW